ncbi:MAG: 2-oxoglutarate dehydrogenase, E2 component, dihydrolipoamide succinyltransferase [Actinomycetales bacterium]|nr:2-oxoglutarate dehydrogenase, E2 component, dihydrolipoamide succinyltransferase [Actinomycetales bacterium]
MTVSVTMPALGESVTEGTVTRWLKAVGDPVQADEPLLEVSTDKVDTEIPAPASGVLLEITVGEDSVVPVGAQLAVIGEAGESAVTAQEPTAAEPAPVPAVPVPAAPVPAAPVPAAPEPAAPRTTAPAAGAATPIVLPALGESVTEGTITRWLRAVGDVVAADEPLLEVSTDKVDTEIPAPASGTLLEITVGEDQTAPVGAQLGLIGEASSAPVPAAPAPAPAPAPEAPQTSVPEPVPAPPLPAAAEPAAQHPSTPDATSADAYVTPLVRRLAAQHGIDLSTVVGTGVGGRIRKQDVMAAASAGPGTSSISSTPQPVAPAPSQPAARTAPPSTTATAEPTSVQPATGLRGRTEKMPRLRRVIAERMVESLQVSAQLTTVIEVDVTRINSLRGRVKDDFEAREGVKLTFLPFFCQAAVEALKQFPQVNASIDMEAGTVTYHDVEHLGIAVDTERGLLVPVIRDAGDLNIAGLARKIADVAERTRTNKVSPDELSGGTFTITNTGSRGSLFDTPIINQPQVAILGTGAVVKRPVVINDGTSDVIAVRSMAYLALSYDHRLVDGADAARFLGFMKVRLEEAAFEAELGL